MGTAKKIRHKYTYRDYLTWGDDERWEIIGGEAYNMSPAPTFAHQQVVARLTHFLMTRLEGKQCIPVMAPIDVVLSEEDVVQPDVIVVCDKQKIQKTHIAGAPDLVIEVLSPSTSLKDRREKKDLYEKFGVKEYLLVDPDEKYVERYFLQKGKYGSSEVFGPKDKLASRSLKGVRLPLKEIFS
ncbi:MAG: Uma2 family endonuclease [Deltaproteobacteria bacterium]|nr:Uma2 family endonuclease [Deltaproteobacteria bacterium]